MNGVNNNDSRRRRRLGWVALGFGAFVVIGPPPARKAPPEWLVAVAVPTLASLLAVWVGLGITRRVHRRRGDQDAHEHLQLLLDRTCLPHVHLVAVVATEWVTQAGQAAATVDVIDGQAGRHWFSLACFPPGSLVLINQDATGLQMLDWMRPDEVQGAHRHRARQCGPRHRHEAPRASSRRQSRRLVAEVEDALRRSSATAVDGPTPDVATGLPLEQPHDRRRP